MYGVLERVFDVIVDDDGEGPHYFGKDLYYEAVGWWCGLSYEKREQIKALLDGNHLKLATVANDQA
jgi:hypothetical protein